MPSQKEGPGGKEPGRIGKWTWRGGLAVAGGSLLFGQPEVAAGSTLVAAAGKGQQIGARKIAEVRAKLNSI